MKKGLKKAYNLLKNNKNNFLKKRRLSNFILKGYIPWSKGYNDYKWDEIRKALTDNKLLEEFKCNKGVKNYGQHIDERIVELPWVLAKLSLGKGNLLDAGSSLNHKSIVNHPIIKAYELYVYTYFPESENFVSNRISYVFGDLRKLPFKDTFFDQIACISTLEHIDMDNSIYGYDINFNKDIGNKSFEYLIVIKEFLRTLKKNGVLLITVPFGKFENHGFFQQFDTEMIDQIRNILVNHGVFNTFYFKYLPEGWERSTKEKCASAVSFNPHTGEGKGDDGAAHSRAICCIEFIKESL